MARAKAAPLRPELVLILIALLLSPLALGQSTTTCESSSCSDIAYRAVGCGSTSYSDPEACYCDATAYTASLSACLVSSTSLGCSESDYDSAFSDFTYSCSYYTASVGSALCASCALSGASSLSCLDEEDYGCLCRNGKPSGFVEAFASCAASNSRGALTCPPSWLSTTTSRFTSRCSSYLSSLSGPPACQICQAEAALALQCADRNDYECLCTQDNFINLVDSCISSAPGCRSAEITPARDTYSRACEAVATGGTPPHLTASAAGASATGPGATGTAADSSGPDGGTIAGIVVGVVAGLALLSVGGYFIFRRRRPLAEKENRSVPEEQTAQDVENVKVENQPPSEFDRSGVDDPLSSGANHTLPHQSYPTSAEVPATERRFELDNQPR